MTQNNKEATSILNSDELSLMLDLLESKKGILSNDLEKARRQLVIKQNEYDNCIAAITTIKMSFELQANLDMSEGYSKQWKWPTKTLFILKVIL